MTGPIVRLVFSLRRQLHISRAAHAAALVAVARKEAQIAELSRLLAQTRRDAELLALGSRDRDTSLAFLRAAHEVDGLDQADG